MTSRDVFISYLRWVRLNRIAFEEHWKQTSFQGEREIQGARLTENHEKLGLFSFYSVTLALNSFAVAFDVKQEAPRKNVFGVSNL